MVDIKISQLTNVSSSQLTDLFEISRNLGGGSFESHSLTYRDLLHSIVGDNIITVDSDSSDATSIEDAISQANAKVPSSTNPVVILVQPGVYTENNPLTVPDYVSIIAFGDSNTTSILATTTTLLGSWE